jgi:hypothetical protein
MIVIGRISLFLGALLSVLAARVTAQSSSLRRKDYFVREEEEDDDHNESRDLRQKQKPPTLGAGREGMKSPDVVLVVYSIICKHRNKPQTRLLCMFGAIICSIPRRDQAKLTCISQARQQSHSPLLLRSLSSRLPEAFGSIAPRLPKCASAVVQCGRRHGPPADSPAHRP